MRQVMVQKGRGLIRCPVTWENGGVLSQSPFPLSVQAHGGFVALFPLSIHLFGFGLLV